MADAREETVARLLNMAGLAKSHAKDICMNGGVELSLDEKTVDKLKDFGFALFRVISK